MNIKVGFIGGGNMAASMIGGLANPSLSDSLMGAKNVWVYDRNQHKIDALKAQYAVQTAESCEEIIALCDVVVFAVKPHALKEVLSPLINIINNNNPLLISVAAGIKSNTIERWLGNDISLVRVMPNTPSLIGLGASGLFANNNVSEPQKQLCSELMKAIGIIYWVDDESGIDLVTALSGSGPAYFMLFIQSLIDAAVNAGMNQNSAKQLAIQTALGTAELIKQSKVSIPELIQNVSSPNGTTEQAIKVLQNAQLPSIVADAFAAAKHRSEQLAIEFDN